MRFDRDAVTLAVAAHRFDDFCNRAVHVQRKALHRLRLDQVAQVLHEPLQRFQLALNGLAEHLPRLRIDVVAQQQARVVADVLDRVRQIVHEAGGDTAEHRLSLFLLDVLLELRQPVGHGVERGAELAELVAAPDADAGVELTGGDVVSCVLQREDRIDERPAEQVSD